MTKVAPGSSTYSGAAGLCPHQTRTVGAVVRSKAKRVLPPQASAPATVTPFDSSSDPSGASRKKGQDRRWGCTPPRESTTLIPGVRDSVVVVHSADQSPPPKCVRRGEAAASRGEAAATSWRVTGPGLTVGDAHPLAQDAVVLGEEAQRHLERAIGVDEDDLGLRPGYADILHLEASGRGAVTMSDPQRRRPGRILVVGRISQGVQRRWDPGRQLLHMPIDVRPEPCLAQPSMVTDQKAVSGAPDDTTMLVTGTPTQNSFRRFCDDQLGVLLSVPGSCFGIFWMRGTG